MFQAVPVKKPKAASPAAKPKVVVKPKVVAKPVAKPAEAVDSETAKARKREQIEQLKGKVIQLRKVAGKPVPGAVAKKKSTAEASNGELKAIIPNSFALAKIGWCHSQGV